MILSSCLTLPTSLSCCLRPCDVSSYWSVLLSSLTVTSNLLGARNSGDQAVYVIKNAINKYIVNKNKVFFLMYQALFQVLLTY